MRRPLLFVAALLGAVYLTLPPRPRALPPAPPGVTAPVRGAIHVHTRRSDGGGTPADVAAAAARAGLQFVVLTDHGHGTRAPDPPIYLDGVLVVDAVEISTDGGHVVALGMPKAPYPLAGEARDVVEDVARLGGFAIAAHPTSTKPELQWTEWGAPLGGLEWLNADSEWRDETPWRLARALLAYPARPAEAIGLLLDRSDRALRRWDALTRRRRVVAMAAADAHARIGAATEESPSRVALPIPGYEAMFRAFSIALPDVRLAADAAADARTVLDAIRRGHLFSSVDTIAARGAFTFTASSGAFRASGGDLLPLAGPVRLEVHVQADSDVQIGLIRDGVQLLEARGPSLRYDADATPAVYRIEVKMPGAPGEPPVPWIVSNPIYVGVMAGDGAGPADERRAAGRPAVRTLDLDSESAPAAWQVEHSPDSSGAVERVRGARGIGAQLRYALGAGASSPPFTAFVVPTGASLAGYERLAFTARADRPMRLSVQLRRPTADPAGERWHRSVYLDTTERAVTIAFDDMRPRGATQTATPPLGDIASLLLVVDTVNTRPRSSGTIRIDGLRDER